MGIHPSINYGNRKPRVPVRFSRWGLDSTSPLDLRMGRWGRGVTDKSSDIFYLYFTEGIK